MNAVQWFGTGLLVIAAWAVHVWWRPFASCWRCGGGGRFKSSRGGSWRKCPRCRGKGERLRVAPRVTARSKQKARARRRH